MFPAHALFSLILGLGRPKTAALYADHVRKLYRAGTSKSEIVRRLQIGRTSVRRILKNTIYR